DVQSLMNKNNAKKFAAYSWLRFRVKSKNLFQKITDFNIAMNWYNPYTNIVLHNVGQEKN
ncbi:hypothetical protein HN51_043870, partial [Arachis hypogaea]